MNRDGNLDIVTANYANSTFSVLLGNGDGTFRAKLDYVVATSPFSVAIADVNGDGKPDIVSANRNFPATVSVLLGNGDGTFKIAVDYGVGNGPYSVAIADVNRDGKVDIVTANTNRDKVSVLLGNGDGTFNANVDFGVGSYPYSVAIADVNEDSKPDIITTNTSDGTVSVLLNACGPCRADVDGNGTVDLRDAVIALRVAAGLQSCP